MTLEEATTDAATNSSPIDGLAPAIDGPVVVRTQREFLDAIRQRVERLNVSRESVDAMCGLAARYSNKLLSPAPLKRLGVGSLFALARGLGLNFQLVEDPEATAQIMAEVVPRKLKPPKSTSFAVHRDLTYRFMRRIGRKGGTASRSNMSRRQASELGRRAARARWAKAKATKPYVGTSRNP
jgi:hypothetical protein